LVLGFDDPGREEALPLGVEGMMGRRVIGSVEAAVEWVSLKPWGVSGGVVAVEVVVVGGREKVEDMAVTPIYATCMRDVAFLVRCAWSVRKQVDCH